MSFYQITQTKNNNQNSFKFNTQTQTPLKIEQINSQQNIQISLTSEHQHNCLQKKLKAKKKNQQVLHMKSTTVKLQLKPIQNSKQTPILVQLQLLVLIFENRIQFYPLSTQQNSMVMFNIKTTDFVYKFNQIAIDCKCSQNYLVLLTNSQIHVLQFRIQKSYNYNIQQLNKQSNQKNQKSQKEKPRAKDLNIYLKMLQQQTKQLKSQKLKKELKLQSLFNKSIFIQKRQKLFFDNLKTNLQFQEKLFLIVCGQISKHQFFLCKLRVNLYKNQKQEKKQTINIQQKIILQNKTLLVEGQYIYQQDTSCLYFKISIQISNFYSYFVCQSLSNSQSSSTQSSSHDIIFYNPVHQKFKPVSLTLIKNQKLNELIKLQSKFKEFSSKFLQQHEIIKKCQLCPIVQKIAINSFNLINQEIFIIIGNSSSSSSQQENKVLSYFTFVWVYNINKSYTMNWMEFNNCFPLKCFYKIPNQHNRLSNLYESNKNKIIYGQFVTVSQITNCQKQNELTKYEKKRQILTVIRVNFLQHQSNHQKHQITLTFCQENTLQHFLSTKNYFIILSHMKKIASQIKKNQKNKLSMFFKIPKEYYYRYLLEKSISIKENQQFDQKKQSYIRMSQQTVNFVMKFLQ